MKSELLEESKKVLQLQRKSLSTEQSYLDWIYRFMSFHKNRNPYDFNEKEMIVFLGFLREERKVSPSTQSQCLQALMFFYRNVLNKTVASLPELKIHKLKPLPDILTRTEISLLFSQLKGEVLLMASLLYGCGLRAEECLSLRIRNVDLPGRRIFIEDQPERQLFIPANLYESLSRHVEWLKLRYEEWQHQNFHGVYVPLPGEAKMPAATTSWEWQYLFPSVDGTLIKNSIRHRSVSFLEKALKKAAQLAGITKRISCHVFRHSFATHLLEKGCDIHLVQKTLGQSDIRSTLVYLHLLESKAQIQSPFDLLESVVRC